MTKLRGVQKVLKHQRAFIESNHKHPALVGGYGSGKSEAAVFRTISQLRKRNGTGTVIIGAPTFSLIDDVNIPDFQNFFEQFNISYRYMKKDHKMSILGSKQNKLRGEIWFRGFDRPERWVGFEATDCILDEFDTIKPVKQKDIWNKAIARIRKCNNSTLGITTTPEGYRYTYKLNQQNKLHLIKAKTTDNIYLPLDYIESMRGMYDAKLVEQYLNGEFVNVNGDAAYYAFNHDVNLIEPYKINTSYICCGMDFNVDPMTCVLGVYDGHNLTIFDEFYIKNSNTEAIGNAIREKYPRSDIEICPDMTGRKRQTSAAFGQTDLTILTRLGFRISGTNNPFVKDRITSVNNGLSKGRIKIFNNLTHTITDLDQVVRDKYGEIDKSDLRLTHISDALGYLVWRKMPLVKNKHWIM